jgi:dTMP kinase
MFITFEGPEGSGKSSQIRLLADFLRGRGETVLATREPGGTAVGDQIRACLHDATNTEITAVTEFLLFSASRAQLVRQVIGPALAAGQIVLCDRYADSTIAYQGYGRGLDRTILDQITAFAAGDLRPDLTLLLDIDVEKGLARRRQNAEEMTRLDLETLAFHRRVRQGYHALAVADPGRWCVIDADEGMTAVQAAIRAAVLGVIGGQ